MDDIVRNKGRYLCHGVESVNYFRNDGASGHWVSVEKCATMFVVNDTRRRRCFVRPR